ncbi:MAG: hypothetical protein ACRBBU_09685 [Pseudooceanicola sp.]
MANFSRLAAICGALTVTAACALPPQGVKPDQMAAYDGAVASVGCVMENEPQYLAVEIQTGMTREQAIAMGKFRVAAGQAKPTEAGGIRLTSGACAA